MHKLGLGIMTAAAAFSIAAFAQSGNSPSQYCDANGDLGVPHDVCVACYPYVGTPVCQCKLIELYFPDMFNEEYGTLGQCISFYTQYVY